MRAALLKIITKIMALVDPLAPDLDLTAREGGCRLMVKWIIAQRTLGQVDALESFGKGQWGVVAAIANLAFKSASWWTLELPSLGGEKAPDASSLVRRHVH